MPGPKCPRCGAAPMLIAVKHTSNLTGMPVTLHYTDEAQAKSSLRHGAIEKYEVLPYTVCGACAARFTDVEMLQQVQHSGRTQ